MRCRTGRFEKKNVEVGMRNAEIGQKTEVKCQRAESRRQREECGSWNAASGPQGAIGAYTPEGGKEVNKLIAQC